MDIYDIISLNYSQNEHSVSSKRCRESQKAYFMFYNFFPENHAVNEIMWKNMLCNPCTGPEDSRRLRLPNFKTR